jgi:hypothetical protein
MNNNYFLNKIATNACWQKNYFGFSLFHIWLFGIFILSIVLSCALIPLIPVANGVGWDGGVYYGILQSLCKGELGRGAEPYYFLRIGSILHLYPIEKAFNNTQITLGIARLFSSVLAVSGIVLAVAASYKIYDCLSSEENSIIKMNSILRRRSDFNSLELSRLLIVVASVSTFAVFTMPTFYPVLSDHLAIFISGLSLYIWHLNNKTAINLTLALICFLSLFIMPSLFLIPSFLMIFPRKEIGNLQNTTNFKNAKILPVLANSNVAWFWTSLLTSIILVTFIFSILSSLNLHIQRTSMYQTAPGIPELRFVSMLLILLITALYPFIFFRRFRNVICSINIIKLVFSFLLLGLFFIIYSSFATNKAGFQGPNLINNLAQQSLSSPISSFPAVFSYFGPVGIIGIYSAMFGRFKNVCNHGSNNFDAIAALSMIFIFFLLIGNETRQFICVLPLLVYLTCLEMDGADIKLLIFILIYSISLLFIGHPMDINLSSAITQKMDAMAYPWQSYFGRQGPWMSTTSRLLWSSLLIIFLIGYEVIKNTKNPIRK